MTKRRYYGSVSTILTINKRGSWPGNPVRAIAPPDLRDIMAGQAVFYEPFPIGRSWVPTMIRIVDRLIVGREVPARLAGPPAGIVEAYGLMRFHLLPVPEHVPMAVPGAGICYNFTGHQTPSFRLVARIRGPQ